MASSDLISQSSFNFDTNGELTVFEIIWNLLESKRLLLYDLFDAVREIQFEKINEKSKKKSTETSYRSLDRLIEVILSLEPSLVDCDPDKVVEALLTIENSPPPPLPCPFEEVLLKRPDGVTLINHEKISCIYSFLDVDSLLSLSLCSRSCFYSVKVHMNKELYNLPFNREPICTNLTCWKRAIDFFFEFSGVLKPIDRTEYPPLIKIINSIKSFFPVTNDSFRAHTYVTFDYIQPHYIVYCNHDKPMSHTCSSSNMIDCDNKATTKEITISEFISEYNKRFHVKEDNLILGFESKSSKFICLLLKNYLNSITECINKHDGKIEYRRTEFISNCKHQVIHRIWLQISLRWDFRFGSNPQNSLYLTIADHFILNI